MRKLLIVDDERHVVNWLYELFSLESGLDLDIYCAYSAREALKTLAQTKIDVVLTDIKMPGMSGLELLERIYERWPFCRTIILTGYQNFDYIYHSGRNYPEAVYLMKTEDDDVILDAVRRQLGKIDDELRTLRLRDESAHKSVMAAQNLFFKSLSDGRSFEDSQRRMDELGIQMDVAGNFLLAAGKLVNIQGSPCYDKLFEIQSVVRKYVSHLLRCAQWTCDGEVFYWLLQPMSDLGTQHTIRDLFEDVQVALLELLGLESSFIISGAFELYELSAKTAGLLAQLYGAAGTDAVLMEQEPAACEDIKPLSLQTIETLEANLVLGKQSVFLEIFDSVMAPVARVRSLHNTDALASYFSISLILQRHINRVRAQEQLAFKAGLYKLTRPDLFANWAEAMEFLRQTAVIIFDMGDERSEGYQLKVVASIKQYVGGNLGGGLSLANIADKMKYNPSYISRMFKRVEGINLSDYINTARMSEAKRLLLEGNLSINEIAAVVGFESPQYFATVFKKSTGLSPHQFQLERLITET